MAITMVIALFVMAIVPIGRPGFTTGVPVPVAVSILFLTTALPFFFGSMLMARLFASQPDQASRLYFADLVGASLACLLAIPILAIIGGFSMPFLSALLALVPAIIASWRSGRRLMIITAAAIAIVGLGTWNIKSNFVELSPNASGDDREILFSKWSFSSWITVETNLIGWRGWRLSDAYNGPDPEYGIIRQDGHAPAFIRKFDGNFDAVRDLKFDITSLPYRIFDPKRVLVIGAGGGRDILTAKTYGVPHVTGVELHPITANDVMRGAMRDYSGNVYGMDGVDVVVDNGRTYVERTDATFDFVYTSLADTLLGNSQGVYVLSENHLYTVEAFSAYLDVLNPGGLACILYTALEEGHLLPRFMGNVILALREHGIENPADHVIAIMTPDPEGEVDEGVCIMYGLDPLTETTVARAQSACDELGFTLAWPPQSAAHEANAELSVLFEPQQWRSYLADSYFDLSPLRDDRPYLFYSTKPSNFLDLVLNPIETAQRGSIGERRFPILVDIFFVVLILVLVLMISPLLLFKRDELSGGGPLPLALLLLFLLLGVAFMFIEVALLQKLFVYLGNPTLTFSVVLGIMLFFTGTGSYLSRRFNTNSLWRYLALAALAAVAMQLLVGLSLDHLTAATLGYPMAVRLVVCCPLIAAISLPMGMLFPITMRLIAQLRLNIVCWAWGMNGVGSVLGSVGASLLALNLGIQNVFFAGISVYGLVGLVVIVAAAMARRQSVSEFTRDVQHFHPSD